MRNKLICRKKRGSKDRSDSIVNWVIHQTEPNEQKSNETEWWPQRQRNIQRKLKMKLKRKFKQKLEQKVKQKRKQKLKKRTQKEIEKLRASC